MLCPGSSRHEEKAPNKLARFKRYRQMENGLELLATSPIQHYLKCQSEKKTASVAAFIHPFSLFTHP